MANDSAVRPSSRNPLWFKALLLVDAFGLGGLFVWRLVLNLLEGYQVWTVTPDAIRTMTGIDHTLFVYWVGHTAVTLVLVAITIVAYVGLRTWYLGTRPAQA